MEELINNTQLAEKLAENINKVKLGPEVRELLSDVEKEASASQAVNNAPTHIPHMDAATSDPQPHTQLGIMPDLDAILDMQVFYVSNYNFSCFVVEICGFIYLKGEM